MEQWLELELENKLPCFNFFSSTFIIFLLRHLLKNWSLLPHFVILIRHHWVCDNSTMVTKMKGIYKGFKYITQIFVVKEEREMEISCPTDVKHVAHIGWDGPSGSGPTWMNEFKTAPDFSTSIGSLNERRDPKPTANASSWSTQDCEEPTGSQATSNIYQSDPSGGVAHAPKKPKRKKIKSTSSPTKSSTRQPRAAKSKAAATYHDREAKPVAQVQQAQEIN